MPVQFEVLLTGNRLSTDNNIDVTVFVRNYEEAYKLFADDVSIILFHSKEYEALLNSVKNIDVFYHLAWGGVAPEKKNDRAIQIGNIDLAMEMLQYANTLGVKRFIATGTVAEYSFCEGVMDLEAKQTPNDLYGAAKTATHYMLETWARQLGVPFNWIVIPSTYGEGRKDDNILTYTIRTLLNGEKPQYGYLTQMWDFLYVYEVARALVCIGDKGKVNKTYGIGSGIYKPLRYYIETIRDIIDPSLELGIGDIPSMSEKVFSSCVPIKELEKDTGFVPQIYFEEGIKRTINYYKKER